MNKTNAVIISVVILFFALTLLGGYESLESPVAKPPEITGAVVDYSTPAMLARWKFDETYGTGVSDSSGNIPIGNLDGATWILGSADPNNVICGASSLYFDGINDNIYIPHNDVLSLTKEFTIEFWIKMEATSAAGYRGIIDKAGNYQLRASQHSGYSRLGFGTAYYNPTWTSDLGAGGWHHAAIVWKPGDLRIYADGVKVAGPINIPNAPASSADLYIGKSTQSTVEPYFKGYLDEIIFWNRAMSGAEIINRRANPCNIVSCNDADRGDYYKAGVCIGSDGAEHPDSCKDVNTLNEWSCSESATCVKTEHSCTDIGMCKDGACISLQCGNGQIDTFAGQTEACDDSDTDSGDGCSSACTKEDGWTCDNTQMPSVCTTVCGDNLIKGNEVCDFNNVGTKKCADIKGPGWIGTLKCSADCLGYDAGGCSSPTPCGNGIINDGETCDDKNTKDGDGCSAVCKTESGWSCPTPGQPCEELFSVTIHASKNIVIQGDPVLFTVGIKPEDLTDLTIGWDTGKRITPWGRLNYKEGEGLFCVPYFETVTLTDKCAVGLTNPSNYAKIDGQIDVSKIKAADNPCVCKEAEDYPYIYPLIKSGIPEIWISYENAHICTPPGQNQTSECEVKVFVTDKNNNTVSDSAMIHLQECTKDADCEDGNICTIDKCVGGSCSHSGLSSLKGKTCGASKACSENGECISISPCIVYSNSHDCNFLEGDIPIKYTKSTNQLYSTECCCDIGYEPAEVTNIDSTLTGQLEKCEKEKECSDDLDCPDEKPFCDISGVCIECTDDVDCEDKICVNGTCASECSANSECEDGNKCTLDICEQEGYCSNLGDVSLERKPCDVGKICDAFGSCAKCLANSDCTGGKVCYLGECVAEEPEEEKECRYNSDCAEGEICYSGECIEEPEEDLESAPAEEEKEVKSMTTWIIAIAVIGVIAVILLMYFYKRKTEGAEPVKPTPATPPAIALPR